MALWLYHRPVKVTPMPASSVPSSATGVRADPRGSAREKSARLQARVSPQVLLSLRKAAAIEGVSVSEYVLAHAREAASRTLREQRMLELSARDAEVFLSALETPWTPTTKLRADVRRMETLFDGN